MFNIYIKAVIQHKWIILVILTLSFSFYWYEWRPAKIEQECAVSISILFMEGGGIDSDDFIYDMCVKVGGIDNFIELRDKYENIP